MSDRNAFLDELHLRAKEMKNVIISEYNGPNADKQQIKAAIKMVEAAEIMSEMAVKKDY